jgi:hypothetical protein
MRFVRFVFTVVAPQPTPRNIRRDRAARRTQKLRQRAAPRRAIVISLTPLRPAERREVSDELDVCERLALGHGFVSGADLRCETVMGEISPAVNDYLGKFPPKLFGLVSRHHEQHARGPDDLDVLHIGGIERSEGKATGFRAGREDLQVGAAIGTMHGAITV